MATRDRHLPLERICRAHCVITTLNVDILRGLTGLRVYTVLVFALQKTIATSERVYFKLGDLVLPGLLRLHAYVDLA